VLKGIAERLLDSVRACDVLARWGGEELMLLAPETGGAAALKLADKLGGLIREPAFAQVGRVTVSIGVAELTGADTCQTLFQRLDRALYAAKAAGRDCYRQA
jgi:diguanylate cyclase (GGDEF)-like protein